MNFKIDTKEKFQVIRLLEEDLSVNMADSLHELLRNSQQGTIKNMIVDLANVGQISEAAAEVFVKSQEQSYDAGYSFVICGLKKEVEEVLEKYGYLELLNTTPTESEAWDIVQMEEIEREFLNDDDLPS